MPIFPNANTPFTPPSAQKIAHDLRFTRAWFDPQFFGLENYDPARPALWIGNHTLFGGIDSPLMLSHLYSRYGVFLRALGDKAHFLVPVWRELLIHNGVLLANPENCATLMQQGANILVFPGGGYEVMRRKGWGDGIFWKQRTGFARLAIEHGYDIIPFAALGANDAYRILLDGDEIQQTRLWKLLARHTRLSAISRGGEAIPPLVRGLGFSSLPFPERFYFKFGERISTTALAGRANDKSAQWEVRNRVTAFIESGLDELKQYRQQDRQEHWPAWRKLLTRPHV